MIRVKLDHVILSLLVLLVALIKNRVVIGSEKLDSLTATVEIRPVPPVVAGRITGVKPMAVVRSNSSFAAELQFYRELQGKSYLTDAEQKRKSDLLNNKAVLRGMRIRISRTPTTAEQSAEQKAAVDLVVEALRSGDTEVATEVLESVVTDDQIEEIHRDLADREDRATADSEALAQWRGLKPLQTSEQGSNLPPAATRILHDVVNAPPANSAALGH